MIWMSCDADGYGPAEFEKKNAQLMGLKRGPDFDKTPSVAMTC